jgi:hypothetical protein
MDGSFREKMKSSPNETLLRTGVLVQQLSPLLWRTCNPLTMTAIGVTTDRYRRVLEAELLEFVDLRSSVAYSLHRAAIVADF